MQGQPYLRHGQRFKRGQGVVKGGQLRDSSKQGQFCDLADQEVNELLDGSEIGVNESVKSPTTFGLVGRSIGGLGPRGGLYDWPCTP